MNNFGFVFGVLCLLATSVIIFYTRRKNRRTMERLSKMIDFAMDGCFLEEHFDETMLSSLESRFFHYLQSAETSAKNVAQEKDKIKTLIGDISHQTKTPIANLLLYSELIMEEPLSPSARASAESIHHQSEKLRFLIDALVKLSRLENGILSLSPKEASVMPMLTEICRQYRPRAQEKGLNLSLEDTALCALFDLKWTSEAIANLVDNAIKYTHKGSIVISAVSYELFTRIDIADTGPGIPEEEQAKIFSRFYRGSGVKEQDGVGIGLYLARQIIAGQGGYIKVTSTPGWGSTFSVFLPR